ncbi:hypothetical protein [Cognatishimia sp.]|uniref:hypothetical protein n=1 Tax=Cognatishimia sp. TaxID=2211648 RepID=UPI003519C626|nr:hypothetical protein [Cognatishimia sp.]NQY58550.1 hypothetical protein [Cognatishimia sp.]
MENTTELTTKVMELTATVGPLPTLILLIVILALVLTLFYKLVKTSYKAAQEGDWNKAFYWLAVVYILFH